MTRREAIDKIKDEFLYVSYISEEMEDDICTVLDIPATLFRSEIKELSNNFENVIANNALLDTSILQSVAKFASKMGKVLRQCSVTVGFEYTNDEERFRDYKNLKERWLEINNVKEGLWDDVQFQINQNDELANSIEEDTLDDERATMRKEIEELRTAKNSLESIMSKQKERYEDVFTTQEFVIQRDLFKEIAASYELKSYYWIGGIVVSSIGFIILINLIKSNFCFDLSCFDISTLQGYKPICQDCGQQILWLEMFKAVFFRFLLISLNIYLITFCVKNYNASMHNKVINETRQNTFNVALHFYNTTTGDGKEDVMRRASESLFSYRNTGYNGKSAEHSSPSFVQNIVDKVNPGK